MNWLNWKPKKQNNELTPETKKRSPKSKQVHEYTTGTFSTLRKAYTTGIKAEQFLSALNPEKGTYFGLYPEPTYTTKERLVMFGETLGEALDSGKSFSFSCVNRKERNELALVAATMLTEPWILKLENMAVSGNISKI